MDAQLVSSPNAKIRDSLEIFTLDAERWLAALYWSVRTCYGNQAARIAADSWLGILENCLDEKCELAELGQLTRTAIVLFASQVAGSSPSAGEF
jgi:hypothetical protein